MPVLFLRSLNSCRWFRLSHSLFLSHMIFPVLLRYLVYLSGEFRIESITLECISVPSAICWDCSSASLLVFLFNSIFLFINTQYSCLYVFHSPITLSSLIKFVNVVIFTMISSLNHQYKAYIPILTYYHRFRTSLDRIYGINAHHPSNRQEDIKIYREQKDKKNRLSSERVW